MVSIKNLSVRHIKECLSRFTLDQSLQGRVINITVIVGWVDGGKGKETLAE